MRAADCIGDVKSANGNNNHNHSRMKSSANLSTDSIRMQFNDNKKPTRNHPENGGVPCPCMQRLC